MTDHESTAVPSTTGPTATDVDPRPMLGRAFVTAGTVVTGVRPDELHLPTPCGAYDVEGLIAHLVAVADRIETIGRTGEVGLVPDSLPVPLGELTARWAEGSARAEAAWIDDATLDRVVRVPWDTMPGRDAVAIYVNELTVHTWDIARAVGRSPEWDPEVLAVSDAAIRQQLPIPERAPMWAAAAEAMGESFDPPFDDAVPVAPDADPIDALVAWNGRRP